MCHTMVIPMQKSDGFGADLRTEKSGGGSLEGTVGIGASCRSVSTDGVAHKTSSYEDAGI